MFKRLIHAWFSLSHSWRFRKSRWSANWCLTPSGTVSDRLTLQNGGYDGVQKNKAVAIKRTCAVSVVIKMGSVLNWSTGRGYVNRGIGVRLPAIST